VTTLKPSEAACLQAWADQLGLPVATLVREALDSRGLLEMPPGVEASQDGAQAV